MSPSRRCIESTSPVVAEQAAAGNSMRSTKANWRQRLDKLRAEKIRECHRNITATSASNADSPLTLPCGFEVASLPHTVGWIDLPAAVLQSSASSARPADRHHIQLQRRLADPDRTALPILATDPDPGIQRQIVTDHRHLLHRFRPVANQVAPLIGAVIRPSSIK